MNPSHMYRKWSGPAYCFKALSSQSGPLPRLPASLHSLPLPCGNVVESPPQAVISVCERWTGQHFKKETSLHAFKDCPLLQFWLFYSCLATTFSFSASDRTLSLHQHPSNICSQDESSCVDLHLFSPSCWASLWTWSELLWQLITLTSLR